MTRPDYTDAAGHENWVRSFLDERFPVDAFGGVAGLEGGDVGAVDGWADDE